MNSWMHTFEYASFLNTLKSESYFHENKNRENPSSIDIILK